MFNKYFHIKGTAALTGFLAAVFFFALHSAAEAQTLGDIFCNAFYNLNSPEEFSYSNVFGYFAYTAGIIFMLQGIYALRMHTEHHNNHPLRHALFFLLGGTLLMVLPATASTIINSIYGVAPAGGGLITCAPVGIGAAGGAAAIAQGGDGPVGGGPGLDGMLSSFMGNIHGPLISLSGIIAILCGIAMMINGLIKASKYGVDPKTHSVNSIIANVVFGALLMTIGTNLDMMLASLFGAGTTTAGLSSALTWSATATAAMGAASASFQAAVNAALTFVQVIGYIAFVRGWLIMKKVVEGGGNVTMAQGVTHICGGVLAINIFGFLPIMDTTFGTGLLG